MKNTVSENNTVYSTMSVRVEDIMAALGIGRSTAYTFVQSAEKTGEPFKVYRVGNSLLIPRKSFEAFLQSEGFM